MELGIHFVNFNLPGGPGALGPVLAATARAAEQGGATMFTLADHLFQMDTLLTCALGPQGVRDAYHSHRPVVSCTAVVG
jgi:alkanesulfonate monooxygenase SsuD/methylene tetrahydromethanopterin reductase-like flavin-dependent oxidoreductase (luciferase family)